MIFTMTSLQRDEVLSGCPSSANKVFVLKDGGIQDPIGESIDAYSNICKILKETLGGVIENGYSTWK